MLALKQGWDQQKYLRIIDDQMDLLKQSLDELEALLQKDPGLLYELKSLRQSLESLYEKEVRTVANQIIATGEGI